MSVQYNGYDRAAERAEKLARDQLRLALANLKPNCWLMPLLSGVICLMFARWIGAGTLLFWFSLVSGGGAYLGVVAFGLLGDATTRRNWNLHAFASYSLFAASWSVFGFLFWRHGNDLNHMLIMLVLACTLAGNAALVGASKPLTILGYAIHGTVLIVTPLREGGPTYLGLAVLAFFYVCYMAYMSRQIYSTTRDMLLLRDDKNGLIDALARSKAESDQARERAEAASRAKSEFLANMSHELRTPLNAILGFSEMIYSDAIAPDVLRSAEYARLIHNSGDHLLALINEILDLAKIESGQFELQESDVDLGQLIGETLRLMTARAEGTHLVLATEVAPDLPIVRADERALRQILVNLLSNALKFTPPGGDVIAFAGIAQSGEIAFGVRDTGIGIDPDEQQRVFQSFGQGRHDVADADKGTGLGLAIVKGLCEAHGGRVDLTSEVGKGTCVTAILPETRARPRLRQAS
ncbi:MAG TPA: ATP-binding protein [Rhizomicrobium sp.]